ncbi:hypothetical protein IMY96_05635 [Pimelobacter simplex]|nr:hypothetical protein [Pimelobacter simplex]
MSRVVPPSWATAATAVTSAPTTSRPARASGAQELGVRCAVPGSASASRGTVTSAVAARRKAARRRPRADSIIMTMVNTIIRISR